MQQNYIKYNAETPPKIPKSSTGKERDSETGFSYFGARYYDSDLMTGWLSVDPMADKYPGLSPYAYCAWNPIRLVDPDGRWVWNKVGDLVAEKGDNIKTMSDFLGTSIDNCATIMNRCGLNNESMLNVTSGYILSQKNLWIDNSVDENSKTINSNFSAVMHYYFGNGEPVNIDNFTTSNLFNSSEFKNIHNNVTNKNKNEGRFSIDMTGIMFHIGRTNGKYRKETNGKSSSITYTVFMNDGFWDPAFWSEKTLGEINKLTNNPYTPDGNGPHLELGGTPYNYNTRERTYFYKPE